MCLFSLFVGSQTSFDILKSNWCVGVRVPHSVLVICQIVAGHEEWAHVLEFLLKNVPSICLSSKVFLYDNAFRACEYLFPKNLDPVA